MAYETPQKPWYVILEKERRKLIIYKFHVITSVKKGRRDFVAEFVDLTES
jgi:hypothetical protein